MPLGKSSPLLILKALFHTNCQVSATGNESRMAATEVLNERDSS